MKIYSIGIDTWGVDFVYVGSDGCFLGLPRAYRDPYTTKILDEFFSLIPKDELYKKTGIQIMNFNSLFQLYAANKELNSQFMHADKILFIPDALIYLLSNKMVCEYTILSTSQFMNPITKQIDSGLLESVGVNSSKFPDIVMPGTIVGELSDKLASETKLGKVSIVTVASHDTGSAVASVPALDENFAFLSSGTWSLMGIETSTPIITDDSFKMNFTNEGGIDNTNRFLKNITGMWLLEQCRAVWSVEGKTYSYQEIVEITSKNRPFVFFIDPDDVAFATPTNMVDAIKSYCVTHSQGEPMCDGEIMRCIFDSLAMKYRLVLGKLTQLAPFEIKRLHVIGGGSKNSFLNQLTANAIGLPVIAGPSEATVIGNIMVQAQALGLVSTLTEMRKLIDSTMEKELFSPNDKELWDKGYSEFLKITGLTI